MTGGGTEDLVTVSERIEAALGAPPLIRVDGKKAKGLRWQYGPHEDPDRWRNLLAGWDGNVGLVGGFGLVTLDFDVYKPEGALTFQLLEDAGLIPTDTVRAQSGGGGLHVFLRYDPQRWRVTTGDFGKVTFGDRGRLPGGGEWKGEGGMVVVAPSVHVDTGLPYLWEDGCAPGETELASAPDELLEMIGRRITGTGETHGRGRGGWSNYDPARLDPASAEAVAVLLEHFGAHSPILHHDHEMPYASVTRPGKRPDGGISATINYSRPGHIHVHSTKWENLPAGPHTLGDLRRRAGLDPPEQIHVHEIEQTEFALGARARSEEGMWLWEGRIPARQFVIAAGIEKLGKSTALVWVCSRLTTGDLPGDFEGQPLTVAYISAEDDSGRVLKPRFQAAEADPNRYWMLTSGGVFTVDVLKRLDPRPDVLVLDPISSFVSLRGTANEHGEIAVRQALAPFHDLAVNENITVIGVRHGRKGAAGDNPLDMVMGSKAWAAAARALLIFTPDREHEGRPGGLIFGRGNLAAPSVGLRYRLDQVPVTFDKAVVRPSTGELVTDGVANLFVPDGDARITLDEALGPRSQATERVNAESFLLEQLAAGKERPASELAAVALEDHGISDTTLRRARQKLRVLVRRDGFGPGSQVWWSLPSAKTT
jgi:hypothetical protein